MPMAETSLSPEREDNTTVPDLKTQTQDGRYPSEVLEDEVWDGPDDPDNPLNWSPSQKWSIILLISTITLVFSSSSSIFGPALPEFLREFDSKSDTIATLTISEYAAGYILGPLVIAPLSELYGRLPVVHASNLVFVVFTVACAVSSDIPMFITFRLGQAFSVYGTGTLGPSFIADLMPIERRGLAMTIFAVGPTLGPSISPTIGGILALKAGWRWIFWFIAIFAGILTILTAVILKETYAPILLARRHARKQNPLGTTQAPTPASVIRAAIVRPVKLLIHSPVTLILALQSSIALSYLNLILSTFALLFQTQYNFTTWQSGLTLFGLGVGFIVGQLVVGSFSDGWLKHQNSRRNEIRPEDRLPPLIIGSILIPTGYFWCGWSIEYHTHWIVPIIGSALVSTGAMFCFLPVSMYLIDAYTVFAASATAGNIMVRSIVSAILPLAAEPLYGKVGYGWGDSIFAFIALAFLPVPIFLVRYGHYLRTHPRFQVQL
ncbi:polyamine transporter 1 [Mollisia scopiformis]|uniref:Polyamine transporter 1 n=1 Tax=Mollisia scopiformis TaxID=149040 RepID=A0A194XH65_MOLSC|nr:polyamine transporter 1 [Mollisia scopiformis]KUJ19469.1 polyamine transporter 1 [Mollisia scopiformis]